MRGRSGRKFLAQRRKGAKRCRVSKRLSLRLCAFAFICLVIAVIFSARAKNEDDVSSLIEAALCAFAPLREKFLHRDMTSIGTSAVD